MGQTVAVDFVANRTVGNVREDDGQGPMRELGLALAVVQQALDDLAAYGRWRGKAAANDTERLSAETRWNRMKDARDFLLGRLWEPENRWGNVLRLHGAKGMTKARLVHVVRRVEAERG